MSKRRFLMKRSALIITLVAVVLAFAGLSMAAAELDPAMQALMKKYKSEAKVSSFSIEAGREFFLKERTHSKGEVRSCSKCHTKDPANKGRTPVGKVIEPMAHSVNKKRYTDPKKVEKWFRRNCKWVLERECTPQEKGNYITYMMSL